MGSFNSWVIRHYVGVIVGLVAFGAAMMVVLAFQNVAAARPSAAMTAGPIPTFTSTPSLRTVELNDVGDRTRNVLFAGDSLTGGLSSSTQEKGFKWQVLKHLEEAGPVKEYNSALSGGTTLQVSEKYPVPDDLDLAVIELGTNDSGNQIPIAQFRDAYSKLLDKVQVGSPDVQIICAGIWEGAGGTPGGSPYDIAIRSMCAKAGGVFVSLRDAYTNPDTIGPSGKETWNGVTDDFHPNDKGHEMIADAINARILTQ